LLDTPGINEVAGEERARIANAAADRADLILFVTDSDLNEIEFAALRDLAGKHKPLILVFNQVDKYSATERQRLLEVLRDERLPGFIEKENVIMTSADPMEREYVIEAADGSQKTELRKPKPDVAKLKVRILEVLETGDKGLLAVNAALFAADRNDKLIAVRMRLREDAAQKTIWGYAATKAIAVGLSPIPALDIIGGSVLDITMVYHLAAIYDIKLSWKTARNLVASILQAAGLNIAAELSVHVAASLLKVFSFGLSTVLTALPQAAAGGFASIIVGRAAKIFFEQNASWGEGGAKTVVARILETTDKEAILEKLRAEIMRRIGINRYSAASKR
jgi:uncharacterized protein (DUF697 family)